MQKVKEVFKRESGEHGTTTESTPSRAYDTASSQPSRTSEGYGNPLHGSQSTGTGGSRLSGVDTSTETGRWVTLACLEDAPHPR